MVLVLGRVFKLFTYLLGGVVGIALAFILYQILILLDFHQYDAAIISLIPFVLFMGAWIITLRVVFKI